MSRDCHYVAVRGIRLGPERGRFRGVPPSFFPVSVDSFDVTMICSTASLLLPQHTNVISYGRGTFERGKSVARVHRASDRH